MWFVPVASAPPPEAPPGFRAATLDELRQPPRSSESWHVENASGRLRAETFADFDKRLLQEETADKSPRTHVDLDGGRRSIGIQGWASG